MRGMDAYDVETVPLEKAQSISESLTGRPSFRDLVAAAAIRMGYRPSSPDANV